MALIADRDRADFAQGNPGPAQNTVGPNGALTATVGGPQAGVPLGFGINRFATVASAGDSGQLPPAVPGRAVMVANDAAVNAANLFPQTGEFINQLSVNAAISLPANKTMYIFCAILGHWHTQLSA